MSILFDMKKGNQHWEQVAEIKNSSQNTYQLISAFASIVPAIIVFVLGIVLASCEDVLGVVIAKVIFWAVATVFSVVVLIVGLCLLKAYGLKWYEFIGENKPKKKGARNELGRGLLK